MLQQEPVSRSAYPYCQAIECIIAGCRNNGRCERTPVGLRIRVDHSWLAALLTSTAGKSPGECVFLCNGRAGTTVLMGLVDLQTAKTNLVELTRQQYVR